MFFQFDLVVGAEEGELEIGDFFEFGMGFVLRVDEMFDFGHWELSDSDQS